MSKPLVVKTEWCTIHIGKDDVAICLDLDLKNKNRTLAKVETNEKGSWTRVTRNKK